VGIVLDSTVLIAAERAGKNPRKVIQEIAAVLGDTEAALSVVSIVELAHGIERANTAERRAARELFINELLTAITPEPVTAAIAFRAGRLDGGPQAAGIRIALGDLLIGAAAVELGYGVVTHNVRHFQTIPNLVVKQLYWWSSSCRGPIAALLAPARRHHPPLAPVRANP
jgi:predicted nucleic acid-binding protein